MKLGALLFECPSYVVFVKNFVVFVAGWKAFIEKGKKSKKCIVLQYYLKLMQYI